jgi:hypothetical protein
MLEGFRDDMAATASLRKFQMFVMPCGAIGAYIARPVQSTAPPDAFEQDPCHVLASPVGIVYNLE